MRAYLPQLGLMLLLIAACTLVNALLERYLSATDAAMIYLLAVMVAAVRFERVVSLFGAVMSFIAFDFFFVPPTFTLRFGSTQYLITGLILLLVGLITSALATRARREMRSSAEAALRANEERLRSTLLASLSHDLRTPLAVIAGSASSLRENRKAMSVEEQDQLLETIFQRSVSMSTEVSDLLEMTRLQAGRVVLNRQWYPIEELVGAALERCSSLTREHTVSVDLPGDLCLVRVDGALIEKLFVNLVENAALHTPAGTHIQVVASRADQVLRVCVRDNGPGLPVGEEGALFDMFERGRRTGQGSGSGLGLSICRAIAQLHGFTITAGNGAGGGAEFAVGITIEAAPDLPATP